MTKQTTVVVIGSLRVKMSQYLGYTWYAHYFSFLKTYEPANDKTFNKICVTSKDSDPPVHPPSMFMFTPL